MCSHGDEKTSYIHHRIVEWSSLEGTSELIYSNLTTTGKDISQLDSAVPVLIQPCLEYPQGGGSHNFPRQPIRESHHPRTEKCLSKIQSKPSLPQPKTISSQSITRQPHSSLPVGSLSVLEAPSSSESTTPLL